jgi:hypothetical protein
VSHELDPLQRPGNAFAQGLGRIDAKLFEQRQEGGWIHLIAAQRSFGRRRSALLSPTLRAICVDRFCRLAIVADRLIAELKLI